MAEKSEFEHVIYVILREQVTHFHELAGPQFPHPARKSRAKQASTARPTLDSRANHILYSLGYASAEAIALKPVFGARDERMLS